MVSEAAVGRRLADQPITGGRVVGSGLVCGDNSQLLHHREPIGNTPVIGYLTVGEPKDVDARPLGTPSGGREPEVLVSHRAPPTRSMDDQIIDGPLVLDDVPDVGKGKMEVRHQLLDSVPALGPESGWSAMIDHIGREQLIGD